MNRCTQLSVAFLWRVLAAVLIPRGLKQKKVLMTYPRFGGVRFFCGVSAGILCFCVRVFWRMRLYRVYVHRFLPMDYCSNIVSHIPVPRVLPAGNVCFLGAGFLVDE